jgi:hypothetical protein
VGDVHIVTHLSRVLRPLADRRFRLMNEWHVLVDDDDEDCTSGTLTSVRSPRAEHGTEQPRGERGVRTILAPPAPPLRSSVGGFFLRAAWRDDHTAPIDAML